MLTPGAGITILQGNKTKNPQTFQLPQQKISVTNVPVAVLSKQQEQIKAATSQLKPPEKEAFLNNSP